MGLVTLPRRGFVRPGEGAALDRSPALAGGLVFLAPLWEGGGAPADLLSTARGTLVAAPTWGSEASGPAMTFAAASTQYVTFPFFKERDTNLGALTIAARVSISANAGTGQTFFEQQENGGTNGRIYLWRNTTAIAPNNTLVGGIHNPSTGFHDSTTPWTPTFGQWYTVAFTADCVAGTTKLYVDGVPQATTGSPGATPAANGSGTGRIGANSANGRPMNGGIAWVAIWNRPLGAAEHRQLADSGIAGLFVPPAALQRWWQDLPPLTQMPYMPYGRQPFLAT